MDALVESSFVPSIESAHVSRGVLEKNPSSWLIAPTLSLLFGQAVAATPIVLPSSASLFFIVPLLLFFWRAKRMWAVFIAVAAIAFVLGYARHRQLLHPQFSSDHLRSIMNESSQVYLEGVLHYEPERLPQRSRWVVRSERVWHPTGAQEITGDLRPDPFLGAASNPPQQR
ncbi:MAG: DUF4131 domain-containing protein [Deltaproteobacteria bacterium]|nr:MAG: DUF4131 domain-containing protein [Deltaproteobacteria bacterium]